MKVTQRRTIEDFARQMRWLVDEAYPDAPVVRVVLDNLNTHRPASLYQTFPAAEARRIARWLEFHYTPKHGSWLNKAEIEFSVFSRSCLRQGLPDRNPPAGRSRPWRERNEAKARVNWRFNILDARIVTADEKMSENAGVELTHRTVQASFTKISWRCNRDFAEGGTSERDLRDERSGPVHPGDS